MSQLLVGVCAVTALVVSVGCGSEEDGGPIGSTEQAICHDQECTPGQFQLCENKCNSDRDCSTPCWDYDRWSTCGDLYYECACNAPYDGCTVDIQVPDIEGKCLNTPSCANISSNSVWSRVMDWLGDVCYGKCLIHYQYGGGWCVFGYWGSLC
jgi:hypothetical protein